LGYDAYGVIDASGTFSDTKRIASLMRMVQAGIGVVDYATVTANGIAPSPLFHRCCRRGKCFACSVELHVSQPGMNGKTRLAKC
jgi:hypothetical protein